ncbi:MAG: hypothetical protein IJV36_03110 [Prevotella sp.]|nr:hypothetical protein [Prevotella sp.]
MKKILSAIAIGVLALIVGACNDEAIDISTVNQQTVLVYMPWSGSGSKAGLYQNFLDNLDSIEVAIERKGGLDKSRLLVFISESASSSRLYEVTYENKEIKHRDIKTYSGHDYTTAGGIAQILNDVKKTAEALNYAMIIGCHGTGWTHIDDWQDYPNNAKSQQPTPSSVGETPWPAKLNDDSSPYEQTRFYGSVSDMSYSTDVETLAEAIRLASLHMQFILFDDCYMANAEVAYELRDVTNFLIASTSEVISIGMPYADMWASLATPTPNYGTAVSAFYNYYSDYSTPCGALSAIDCRQMEALADVMKQINEHYTLPDSLLESIQLLDGFNVPIFYDMGDYVEKLCTDPYLYEKFSAQLAKTVVSKASTSRVYSFLYVIPQFITVETFSGITISDPSPSPVAERGKTKTSWWKATH